jgi:hypothetical protein
MCWKFLRRPAVQQTSRKHDDFGQLEFCDDIVARGGYREFLMQAFEYSLRIALYS